MSLRRVGVGLTTAAALLLAGLADLPGASAVPAGALPSVCTQPSPPTNVYTWVGGQANHDWENAANWQHASAGGDPNRQDFPQDDFDHDGAPNRNDTIVCIPDLGHPDSVFIDGNSSHTGFVWVAELYVEGQFTIQLHANNTGLLVDGATPSSLGPDTALDLRGTFGGTATVHSAGDITATSYHGPCPGNPSQTCSFPVQLTSQKICPASGTPGCPAGLTWAENQYDGDAHGRGSLVVDQGGTLTFANLGAGVAYQYHLEIAGAATVAAGPPGPPAQAPYLAAGDGASVDVDATGTLSFAGNGGLYQGVTPVTGQAKAAFRNFGTVLKSGVGTVSVVGVDFQPQPGGVVKVLSGDLRLPGNDGTAARVASVVGVGSTFGTGACASNVNVGQGDPTCTPVLSVGDPINLALTASATGAASGVVLDEDADPLPYTGVTGHVFQVGAVAPTADGHTPLRLTFGLTGAEVQHLDLGQLTVLTAPGGSNVWHPLSDCPSMDGVPAGEDACLDRSSSAQTTPGGDVVIVVDADDAEPGSRHIISREGAPVSPVASLGSPVVGGTADAHSVAFVAAESYAAPSSYFYSWAADGAPVPGTGADNALLPLTSDLAGKTISLVVLAGDPSWGTGQFTFDLGRVGLGTITGSRPRLKKQGRKLSVVLGPWTAPGVEVTYRWRSGGHRIPGHNSPRLKVKPKWFGKISVQVTASAPGYQTFVRTSRAVTVKR
jgi:hypothetical protein